MKGKMLLYICFIFSLIGCDKHLTTNEVDNMLRSNTFVSKVEGVDVTHTIDFQDSTYAVFENNNRELFWEVISQNNKVYLVQSGGAIEIDDVDSNSIKGRVVTNDSLMITLEKQEVRHNKEDLMGIWVEEKYAANLNKDFPSPPPPPPGPEGTSADDYQWPPLYEIADNRISVRYHYQTNESDILIFNSMSYIMMRLERYRNKEDMTWEIKSLTDSILVINRFSKGLFNYQVFNNESVRFIKIEEYN